MITFNRVKVGLIVALLAVIATAVGPAISYAGSYVCSGSMCGRRQAQNSTQITIPVGSTNYQLKMSNYVQSDTSAAAWDTLRTYVSGSHNSSWNGTNTATIRSSTSVTVEGTSVQFSGSFPFGFSGSVSSDRTTVYLTSNTDTIGKSRTMSYNGLYFISKNAFANIKAVRQYDTDSYQFGSTTRVINCPVNITGSSGIAWQP